MTTGYSATVELWICCRGSRHALRSIGPSHALLIDPDNPPQHGCARSLVVVDGAEHRQDIFIDSVKGEVVSYRPAVVAQVEGYANPWEPIE